MSNFIEILRLISNGDPVDEASINRILRDLDSNTRYALDLIRQAALGQTIIMREQTIDTDVLVGSPVYYDSINEVFAPALAGAEVVDGTLVMTDSSVVFGICRYKQSSTKGDILLYGFEDIDISAAVVETLSSGLYYLSGTTPGKMVKQEPAVSVPVLFRTSNGVYVRPSFTDLYTSHQHYKFDLACKPAGDATLNTGRWTVSTPDDTEEGWLPADHASFDSNAPAGAKFGYNIAASEFAKAWPPIPVDGACLEWERGFDPAVGAVTVPTGAGGLVTIDRNGIWWMTNCEDYVPWSDYYASPPTTTTTSSTTTTNPPCPPTPPMKMTLYFTRTKFLSSRSVVTSLRSGSPLLTVTCTNDESNTNGTGDLQLDVDFSLSMDSDTDTEGYIVLKSLLADGTFMRGPVISALKSGSSNVILSSAGSADIDGYHRGKVTLNVLQNVLGAELPVQAIRLQGATEESYNDALAIGFPLARNSAYRAEVHVPYDIGVTTINVGLRFWLLARAAGDLPDLTLTARVFPRATSPAALVTSDSAVTLAVSGLPTMTINQYVEITSSNIAATPGSVIQFTLTRNASSGDGFSGEVHVLKQQGIITGAT